MSERYLSEDVQADSSEPREPSTSPSHGGYEVVGIDERRVSAGLADTSGSARRLQLRNERPRISGTVLIPNGTPLDEVVTVHAVVRLERGDVAERLATPMAPDGSFEFVLPEGTWTAAALSLESRFLVMGGRVIAEPGEPNVVLEPELFAVIEGQVVPPASVSTEGLSWADLSVRWTLDPYLGHASADEALARRSSSFDKPARSQVGGSFVLLKVPPGLLLEVHAHNPFGPEWVQRVGPLRPGQVRRLEIALESGVTISGRVLDEHDRPVEGVHVLFEDSGHPRERWSQNHPPTDAHGRFSLANVPARMLRISAEESDLVHGGLEFVDGMEGDVHDVVLSVIRGGCIEGTVVWPDREPAERFEVIVMGGAGRAREDGGAGRFRLCALVDGAYRLEVRAARDGVVGTARANDVQVGAAPLELVLEEIRSFDLKGTVVDEQEAPIARFSIHAVGPASAPRFHAGEGSPDGTFVLRALEAGEWAVVAEADGHQSSRQRVVVGEGSALPLRIELRNGGRIRGRVVDMAGAPVVGAWVGEEVHAFAVRYSGPQECSSDAEGRFELLPSSASARILAHKRGFSNSEVRQLVIGPGEDVENIVLVLREPCRVDGRVLDEHGAPVPGANVSTSWTAFVPESVDTDARGVFQLDGLPPGPAALFAYSAVKPDALASTSVTLAPGQPCSVDLRFEVPDPVFVRGRITKHGEPAECRFWLRSSSFVAQGGSGADGRFEVTLRRSGAWRGAVWLGIEAVSLEALQGVDLRRFEVPIPDVDEHAFDLELDALQQLASMEDLWR